MCQLCQFEYSLNTGEILIFPQKTDYSWKPALAFINILDISTVKGTVKL